MGDRVRKPNGHVMVDIETLHNGSNSVITSIGAVEFDLETGVMGREFYTNVDIQSCLNVGLKVNGGTIEWWMKQSDEARNKLFMEPKLPIITALTQLNAWLEGCKSGYRIWGNSNRFDLGILNDAYAATGMGTHPWRYSNERDVRTLVDFAPYIKDSYTKNRVGVAHDALDDCRFQITYCSAIWKRMNAKSAGVTAESLV